MNVNFIDSSGNSKHEGLSNSTDTFELPNGNFEVTIGDAKYPISVRLGGVYTVMVNLGSSNEVIPILKFSYIRISKKNFILTG